MDIDTAYEWDRTDPLAAFRDAFHRHDDPIAYLDGNSLGRPPTATLDRLRRLYEEEWGGRLIRGWSEGWADQPVSVGDRLARVCLGAGAGQTVVADSTSVNLYKVLHAAVGLRPGRDEIVVDDANFPTDRYLVESVAAAHGLHVRWFSPDPIAGVRESDLADVLGRRTAVVVLSHIDYRSGALHDLAGLTARIHDAGALAVWDLCHSVGVVDCELDDAGVDFAVGCTYKYLNAGPGAPAFLYVARRHLAAAVQPITGWWSAEDLFAMADRYRPAADIRRMLSGTPNIAGIVAVDEGVALVERAGLQRIREKAAALTEMCIDLTDRQLTAYGLTVATPRAARERGGHVSLRSDHAAELSAQLTAAGILPDFRNPDLIRLGLSPLSTSYAELWIALDRLREIAARVG